MLQNDYTLPELIDLALTVPEPGIVNFNVLHMVLHTIVQELNMSDIRPWCRVEESMLEKDIIAGKLKEAKEKRAVFFNLPKRRASSMQPEDVKSNLPPTTHKKDVQLSSPKDKKDTESKLPSSTDEKDEESKRLVSAKEGAEIISTDTKVVESKDKKVAAAAIRTSGTVSSISVRAAIFADPEADKKKSSVTKEDSGQDLTAPRKGFETAKGDRGHGTSDTKKGKSPSEEYRAVVDAWKNFTPPRRDAHPPEELEATNSRIFQIEKNVEQLLKDCKMLEESNEHFYEFMNEFGEIKGIMGLVKTGDMESVMQKLVRYEFEIALEELGSAIGLLGVKFATKNDEWEDRAAEIWKALNNRMTQDSFNAAETKIQSRLTALMIGLKKLKEVVEQLLYPESSGVTRCVLCRRSAHISGLECLGVSEWSGVHVDVGDGDNPNKLKKTLKGDIRRKQKSPATTFTSFRRSKTKAEKQNEGLRFTKLASHENEEKMPSEHTTMAVPEPAEELSPKISKRSSQITVIPDPESMSEFTPIRFIPDAHRRNVLLSSASSKEQNGDTETKRI